MYECNRKLCLFSRNNPSINCRQSAGKDYQNRARVGGGGWVAGGEMHDRRQVMLGGGVNNCCRKCNKCFLLYHAGSLSTRLFNAIILKTWGTKYRYTLRDYYLYKTYTYILYIYIAHTYWVLLCIIRVRTMLL